jgi:hypothetical protein
VRLRIFHAISMIFHSDRRELLTSRAVLVHVTARNHGKKSRKGSACASLARHIAGPGKNFGHARRALRCHFFDTCNHYCVVHARGYALPSVKECGAARSARVFKTRAGYALKTYGSTDVRCEVVLTDKRGTSEITQIERFYSGCSDIGVRKRMINRFDSQRAKIAIGERAKSGFADTDHGNRSHIHLRITLMAGPACTFRRASRLSLLEECDRQRVAQCQGPYPPGVWTSPLRRAS